MNSTFRAIRSGMPFATLKHREGALIEMAEKASKKKDVENKLKKKNIDKDKAKE